MKKTPPPTENSAARVAYTALDDGKGIDIVELDVRPHTPIFDTMLICTGTSNRHVQALARAVAENAKAQGLHVRGVEGMTEGEWVLVDLDSVIVHVMQAQKRAFYQLEKLWDIPPAQQATGSTAAS